LDNFDHNDTIGKPQNGLTMVVDFYDNDDQMNEKDPDNHRDTIEDVVLVNE
jgi:hypothetical protein